MRVWFYNNGGIGLICLHSHYNLDISLTTNLKNSVCGGQCEPSCSSSEPQPFLFSTFGKQGNGKGQFVSPWGVACDVIALGRCMWLTLATIASKSSQPRGSTIGCLGGVVRVEGNWLHGPRYVAVGSGIVYVSEHDNHRVSVFTTEGQFKASFGKRGAGPGEFVVSISVYISRYTFNSQLASLALIMPCYTSVCVEMIATMQIIWCMVSTQAHSKQFITGIHPTMQLTYCIILAIPMILNL